MHISILTLFPEQFRNVFATSIISRAVAKGLVSMDYINIRDFATDAYKSVDDHPYGGGVGMILRVDVIDRAIQKTKEKVKNPPAGRASKTLKVILLDPQGTPFTQSKAQELSRIDHLILVCGHYEGVDERVRALVDEELSIGDYVLTGGEIPAMVVTDAVTRLLPGVLVHPIATQDESFTQGLLEYPQYTRPQEYNHMAVPDIILSGDHKKIDAWRRLEATKKTTYRRPDLVTGKKG